MVHTSSSRIFALDEAKNILQNKLPFIISAFSRVNVSNRVLGLVLARCQRSTLERNSKLRFMFVIKWTCYERISAFNVVHNKFNVDIYGVFRVLVFHHFYFFSKTKQSIQRPTVMATVKTNTSMFIWLGRFLKSINRFTTRLFHSTYLNIFKRLLKNQY